MVKNEWQIWLESTRRTDDPAGDFIEDARIDSRMPSEFESWQSLKVYLKLQGVIDREVVAAAASAWKRFERWKLKQDRGR